MSDTTCDLVVVGAGILGLAVAREALRRDPDLRVHVVEREDRVGAHQTGHNSGVVHAGIYYAPGSLKARLCVEGARDLYAFCERARRAGRALRQGDRRAHGGRDPGPRRARMARAPERRARACGASTAAGCATSSRTPRASPRCTRRRPGSSTSPPSPRALAGEVIEAGGRITLGRAVTASSRPGEVVLRTASGDLAARHAVFCAGAWSDRLAVAAGASPDPRIVPFRGAYLRLRPERRDLVRSLIYPVPDPSLPFLGVHLTRHIDGDVLVGPTALHGRRPRRVPPARVRPADLGATLAWPGTWRMAKRWWRTGLRRWATPRTGPPSSAPRSATSRSSAGDVLPGPSGIRAQALARDGALVDDFVISHTGRALHVRNAPSPAATSSLAIARAHRGSRGGAFGLFTRTGNHRREAAHGAA